MAYSIVQLGRSRSDDRALGERVRGDGQRFLILAQRLLWGIDQPDLIHVDVPATAAKLAFGYPDSVAGQMLVAYALRRIDRAAADRALERARSLVTPGHPDTYLMPRDDDEWAGVRPEQQLDCLVPERIWRVTDYAAITESNLARENGATIVRTDDGSLVMANPVRLSESVRSEVEALGEVRAIALQGKAHSRGIGPAREQFPDAVTYGTRSHASHPPSAHLRFDRVLDDAGPADELRVVRVVGSVLEEMMLFHEPTGILITQDFVQFNFRRLARPFANTLYAFGFGMEERIGIYGYHLPLITSLPRLKQSFAELCELDVRGMVSAHGGLVEGEELAGLGDIARWIQGLTTIEHRKMLVRYFSRQPVFLRDMLRYKLKQ